MGMACKFLYSWAHQVSFLAMRHMTGHNSANKQRYRWTGTSKHKDINVWLLTFRQEPNGHRYINVRLLSIQTGTTRHRDINVVTGINVGPLGTCSLQDYL